jgi:pyrimidine operon attenuation protein/uracil phosphoribosyltransferase
MSTGHLSLDAQALYAQMLQDLRERVPASAHLAGITSGGAWLAARLHADLKQQTPLGVVSSSMHRDDFSKRGLADSAATQLPFQVDGAVIWLIDDVLFTGRTIRAVVNELFDYGRPVAVHPNRPMRDSAHGQGQAIFLGSTSQHRRHCCWPRALAHHRYAID